MSVRPRKKFGFQSAAENVQRLRRLDRLRQTVPDRCSSCWKGAVANAHLKQMTIKNNHLKRPWCEVLYSELPQKLNMEWTAALALPHCSKISKF